MYSHVAVILRRAWGGVFGLISIAVLAAWIDRRMAFEGEICGQTARHDEQERLAVRPISLLSLASP